jgi:murein DD-endopeptidase MepM/ murein hydrolase activator NlpD
MKPSMSRHHARNALPNATRRGLATVAIAVAAIASGGATALAQTGGSTSPGGTTTTTTTTAPTTNPFVFPMSAAYPHTYGDGFGVARAGHTHQGQDIMAACGVPLVSVTYGRAIVRRSHASAGNYLVIRSKKARQDYVYAHMSTRALVGKKRKLKPGTPVGYIGATGNASTCHLHFEIWKFPGWYKRGGKPINPLAQLQAWDAYS